jgi:hypothetical protein
MERFESDIGALLSMDENSSNLIVEWMKNM